jgi:hypothetical protein
MKLSPVALFVYNRPIHTRKTIEALSKNLFAEKTNVIIFSDGPKTFDQVKNVNKVRKYIKGIRYFKSVKLIERKENFGLSKSIIEGVGEVLRDYDSIIVLEDDIVTSPHFLKFMNNSLRIFSDNNKVISIHGYVYPTKENLPEAFFLKGADCWGWATWKRGWKLFNPNGQKLLEGLKKRKLIKAFNFDNTYPFYKMLKDQINGKNDSWAVRWYASAFLANKLTLYPGRSLVINIGNDGSGIHCKEGKNFDANLSMTEINLFNIEKIKESILAREAFKVFFKLSNTSKYKLLIRKIENFFDVLI